MLNSPMRGNAQSVDALALSVEIRSEAAGELAIGPARGALAGVVVGSVCWVGVAALVWLLAF